jgi:integrase
VHGLRHTCATLLLAAGVPPHVVQKRLGHAKIEITLNLYAHVLPNMQADAASKLAALLHS